jgi:immune inhibitor A
MSVRFVPPSPDVLAHLHADYLRMRGKKKLSFKQYLKKLGFTDPTARFKGGDEGKRHVVGSGMKLVEVPKHSVAGPLKIIVLLVDFSDNKATRPATQFEDMLFSQHTFQTGSLRDFYGEVTLGKVDVSGTVHGWLRMPKKYSDYVNSKSGTGPYPHNAQKLAEDALTAALAKKVVFPPALSAFKDGAITALIIVHAGQGAEVKPTKVEQAANIWSHKADLRKPFKVAPNLFATNYLTVPEDAHMGVCAHELGHLAFQWDDFYDPNYADDGVEWDGAGVWDLMAGGSWNNGGLTPAHPAGLHKSQHHWVQVQQVAATTTGIAIPPYSKTAGKVVRVISPRFKPTQCLILENRRRVGFDRALPGEGLLVWRVDTDMEQTDPGRPAMLLVEADGRHNLEDAQDGDQGDSGDPFTGKGKKKELLDTGAVSTSFPGASSGIAFKNIAVSASDGTVTLDIVIS